MLSYLPMSLNHVIVVLQVTSLSTPYSLLGTMPTRRIFFPSLIFQTHKWIKLLHNSSPFFRKLYLYNKTNDVCTKTILSLPLSTGHKHLPYVAVWPEGGPLSKLWWMTWCTGPLAHWRYNIPWISNASTCFPEYYKNAKSWPFFIWARNLEGWDNNVSPRTRTRLAFKRMFRKGVFKRVLTMWVFLSCGVAQ